jgi:hypothetical protein
MRDANLRLGQILFDWGLERGTARRIDVVALETYEASASHGIADVLGVLIGRDQHLPARARPTAQFLIQEFVGSVDVEPRMGKGKEQALGGG